MSPGTRPRFVTYDRTVARLPVASTRQVTVTPIICGVDVSATTLDARIGRDGEHRRFAVSAGGLAGLIAFCQAHQVGLVVMEATGGYERQPAGHLWAAGLPTANNQTRQARTSPTAVPNSSRGWRYEAKGAAQDGVETGWRTHGGVAYCMDCRSLGAISILGMAQDKPAAGGGLAAIRARGTLQVCMWPEYFAISYRNPHNGVLEGIDIDMARALAARLGLALRFVETNFAEFMDSLERGDCDVAMMAMGVLPARQARLDFSRPTLASPVYGVTTKDGTRINRWEDIDRPGVVVAVAAGTLMEPLMRQTLQHAELQVVHPPSTREAEVQAGPADLFMSDFPYARRMLLMHDWVRIIEPPVWFGETSYAYAVPKGESAWLAEVDALVAAAKADGSLAAAAARHGLAPILVRD